MIVGTKCYCDDVNDLGPHSLFYHDLDWAVTDCKKRNEDHDGHKVVKVRVHRYHGRKP